MVYLRGSMGRTWVRMDGDFVGITGWFSDHSWLSCSGHCGEGLLLIVWSYLLGYQKAFQGC